MNSHMLVNKIRNSKAAYDYIPVGAGMGWPIPVYLNGTSCLSFLFFVPKDQEISAYVITAVYKSGEVVEYKNLKYCRDDIAETDLCREYIDKINKVLKGSYMENKKHMFELYDKYFECLNGDAPIDNTWYKDFCRTFVSLLEPSQIKYYDFINHEFLNDVMNNI